MKFLAYLLLIVTLAPYPALALTQSADFESGSTQYATATDSTSLSITGTMTLEGWIKLESVPSSGQEYVIFSKHESSGSQRSYYISYDNGNSHGPNKSLHGYADGTGSGGVSPTSFSGEVDLSAGTWYYFAFIFRPGSPMTADVYYAADGDTAVTQLTTLYDAQTNTTSIYDGTAPGVIGAINTASPSRLFDGKAHLIRGWSEARTTTQMKDNWCNALGSTTNLQFEYTLDNTLNDNSGNGNTLTNVNSFVFSTDVPSVCATVEPEQPKDLIIKTGNVIINNGNFIIR